jgi:Na+/melibiose symporter-like transporter
MSDRVQKLSIGEKLGYSLGDSAANFVFQAMIMFQLFYYTNILGISAGAAGTLLLVARIWDAIFDPFMGIIADKTRTRWGKFRPWLLWTALPFGILFYLTFMTPDIAQGAKLAWAYITYIFMMMIYSANNLPYSALGGVMTGDMVERTSIASYRQVAAMGAAFIIQGFFMSMVKHFSHGNDVHGWRVSIGIFASIAVFFHLITFLSTKERIVPKKEQESTSKQAFTDLIHTGPWIAIFLATLFIFTNLSVRGGVLFYYFSYYLDTEILRNFLSGFGYAAQADSETTIAKAFELFNMSGMAFTILGILLSKPLAARFGKRNVFIFGLSLATFFCGIFGAVGTSSPWLTYLINISQTTSYGITIPLLWAMFGDVADYSEWKFKRRATGVVFAAVVFALKFGLGIGGAIGGYLLQFYGYDATNVTDTAITGVRLIASVYPAIIFVFGVICLIFYRIDKKLELQIQNDLEERGKAITG